MPKYGDFSGHDSDIIIAGCRLIQTSCACPEQYDVFVDETGEQIGYLRLRGGWFRADYPECGKETVYEAYPKGDGIFEEDERNKYLKAAVRALKKTHKKATGA